MQAGNILHWGALLAAVMALSWALTALAGMFATLAIMAGLAGAVFLLLAARRLDGMARRSALAGAVLLLLAHAVFVVAFVVAQPLNFKGEPGTGLNEDPPAWASWVTEEVGAWLPIAAVLAAGAALWGVWSLRERALAGAGMVLVVLVQLLTAILDAEPGSAAADSQALLLQSMFALAFLSVATAAALPLFIERQYPAPGTR